LPQIVAKICKYIWPSIIGVETK